MAKSSNRSQACPKNSGSQIMQRHSEVSLVNSSAFKAKAICSRRHRLCNTQELTTWLQKRAALTTACSEMPEDTAAEMERRVSNRGISQQISLVEYHPSSSGSKRGDLMLRWCSSAVSAAYRQD